MTGSDSTTTIYNATDGPIAIDRAGRMLGGRERLEVDSLEGLSSHIDAGRIVDLSTVEAQPDDEPAEDDAAQTPTPRTRKGSARTQEA